jgi:hypothetical protein
MHLEAPKMQDFDLVFNDGRKVICEAKGWKSAFGATQLKRLLNDLVKKKVVLSKNDEFLIVTKTTSNELRKLLRRVRDLSPSLFKDAVKNTVFKEADVEMLQKVKIYEIEQEESAEIAFALVTELIGSWLDSEVLKQLVQSILIDKIYHGSAKGLVIKALEFRELLREQSRKIRDNVGANSQPTGARLTLINEAVKDPNNSLWAPANLSAISGHWGEIIFASDLLKDRKDLELQKWSKVIAALVSLRISHRAFEIIKNNLNSRENIEFAVEVLKKESKRLRASYAFDFHEVELMALGAAIFQNAPSKGMEILEALKSIVGSLGKHKLFVKSKDRTEYLHEKAGELAYSLYEKGDKKLKSAVIEFIINSFCLVEDEGDYWHKAPPAVLSVLKEYLCSSVQGFEQRFKEIVLLLSEQYAEIYKLKFSLPFKGYELIGGVSTWWGNAYSVKDRFFIREILTPSLTWYLNQSTAKAYKFFKREFIFKDELVKREKPDFLRRSIIPILVDIYRENISGKRDEARNFLSVLSSSRKGIPSKHHLIYQEASRITDLPVLWSLISDALNQCDKPLNPFVEKTVCALAQNGHQEAIKVVTQWLSNEEAWTDSLFGGGPLVLLASIANVDIDDAFGTLDKLVFGSLFTRKGREIDIYEWCDFLAHLFPKHPDKVIKLLLKIGTQDFLSDSQQVLVIGTIAKLGKEESIDEVIKVSLYETVIVPILHDVKFVEKYPISHVREQLTDFVEGIVKGDPSEKGVHCALAILERLVNDPSPEIVKNSALSNDSEVFVIESVRGKTAWVLQHFFRPIARSFLPRTLKVLKTLLSDQSTYIRGMACYPFSILLGNRYTFTTDDLSLPLLADSRDEAFQEAKSLEKLAVKFIGSNINVSKNLTKNIPKLYDRLRLVDFDSAKELWRLAETDGVELLKEVLPVLIFNAHFRELFVSGDGIKVNPFLSYLKQEPFDYHYWQNKLEALTLHENEELRASLSWHIMKLSDTQEEEQAIRNIPLSLKYFRLLAKRYDQDVFRSAYMFINEHITEYFKECIDLWFALIRVEVMAINDAIANGKSSNDMLWWPFCFNGKILSFAATQDRELFLQGIELLLTYPEDIRVDLDDDVAAALIKLDGPKERIIAIYDKWISRNSLRFKDKEVWLAAHK